MRSTSLPNTNAPTTLAQLNAIDACGAAKFVCVENTPGSPSRADESFQDIYTQLYNIMEGIGYPATEQYGRGDEVLPLIACEQ